MHLSRFVKYNSMSSALFSCLICAFMPFKLKSASVHVKTEVESYPAWMSETLYGFEVSKSKHEAED